MHWNSHIFTIYAAELLNTTEIRHRAAGLMEQWNEIMNLHKYWSECHLLKK